MNWALGQPPDHDTNHGNIDPRLGVFGLGFVVPHQAAMFHEPTEGAFHDPALGQHDEAALILKAGHHLQPQGPGLAVRRHPRSQLRAVIALVGPQAAQPPKPTQRRPQQLPRPSAFSDVRRGDLNPRVRIPKSGFAQ